MESEAAGDRGDRGPASRRRRGRGSRRGRGGRRRRCRPAPGGGRCRRRGGGRPGRRRRCRRRGAGRGRRRRRLRRRRRWGSGGRGGCTTASRISPAAPGRTAATRSPVRRAGTQLAASSSRAEAQPNRSVALVAVADHGVEGVHRPVEPGPGGAADRRPAGRRHHGVDRVLRHRLHDGPGHALGVEGLRVPPHQRRQPPPGTVEVAGGQPGADRPGLVAQRPPGHHHHVAAGAGRDRRPEGRPRCPSQPEARRGIGRPRQPGCRARPAAPTPSSPARTPPPDARRRRFAEDPVGRQAHDAAEETGPGSWVPSGASPSANPPKGG